MKPPTLQPFCRGCGARLHLVTIGGRYHVTHAGRPCAAFSDPASRSSCIPELLNDQAAGANQRAKRSLAWMVFALMVVAFLLGLLLGSLA